MCIRDSSTGAYNLIPNTSGSETATTKEKGWIILGYVDPIVGELVPYDEIQEKVNDKVGTRRPLYPRLLFSGKGPNLKVMKRPSPLCIFPGNTLDIDLNIDTANISFGLWPLGFEVIRADSSKATGPIG